MPLALHGVVHLSDKLFEDVLQEEDPDESPLRVAHVSEVGSRALHGGQCLLDLVVVTDGEFLVVENCTIGIFTMMIKKCLKKQWR